MQLKARRNRRTVWTRAEGLLTALYLLILVFAIVYDRMAELSPDQFTGISSRADALYFTVTIVSTVGFGDIHATSTAARLLVTVQMLINLVYVGTALRVLSNLHNSTSPDQTAER
ncbi:potassium channel family protein [Pengzhenrongella phosphoraccumulans]|uniref:potassium channel family protein n=1 Tax=Pengzhenrongella phosphoraccumulans TaxID=3114394 RepID=UPI00388EA2F0